MSRTGRHLLQIPGPSPVPERVLADISRQVIGAMEDRIAGRPAMLALPGATPLRGGIPIVLDGNVIGALGVSGVLPDQDHQIAEAGLAAL